MVYLDMRKRQSWDFVEAIMDRKLPQYDLLELANVSMNSESLRRLISNCRPGHPKIVYINYPCKIDRLIFVEKYLAQICSAASKGTYHEFSTWTAFIKNHEFWQLVEAKKKCKKIEFFYCKIETDEPYDTKDMLKGGTFEFLDMNQSGIENLSNWKANSNRLENIIKGLGQSEDVKKSLKKIDLLQSGLEMQKIRRMLDENGLNGVEVLRN
jgi:hypothetical protein